MSDESSRSLRAAVGWKIELWLGWNQQTYAKKNVCASLHFSFPPFFFLIRQLSIDVRKRIDRRA